MALKSKDFDRYSTLERKVLFTYSKTCYPKVKRRGKNVTLGGIIQLKLWRSMMTKANL